MQELVAAYDELIELCRQSEASMIGLAYAHGWRCPEDLVNRADKLRAKIILLKRDLKL